jgi:AcrR family transcriptional regulator
MPKGKQAIEIKRRIPRQARAGETVALILEATAQVLEAGGLPAFTTNAVAERAGVSIGTLYQYFADKNAILLALARQQMTVGLASIGRALQGESDPSVEGRVRAMVQAMVNAFGGRHRARKAVIQAILAQGLGIEMMDPIVAFISAAARTQTGPGPQPLIATLSPEQVFVVSRALMATIRHAVMEEQPFLRSRAFEDEIVRLVVAYLAAIRMQ